MSQARGTPTGRGTRGTARPGAAEGPGIQRHHFVQGPKKVPAEILAKLTAAEAALAAAMTTTGIEGIAADAVESNIWYDLNGRRLDGKPTKTGIYINNHKKVYVK